MSETSLSPGVVVGFLEVSFLSRRAEAGTGANQSLRLMEVAHSFRNQNSETRKSYSEALIVSRMSYRRYGFAMKGFGATGDAGGRPDVMITFTSGGKPLSGQSVVRKKDSFVILSALQEMVNDNVVAHDPVEDQVATIRASAIALMFIARNEWIRVWEFSQGLGRVQQLIGERQGAPWGCPWQCNPRCLVSRTWRSR